MMNHIDSKFKQYRHVRIEAKKENGKTRYNYIPTAMIDELEQVYETYPQTIRHAVDSLINKIKKMDLARAEIVSTLYAVWNNRIIKGSRYPTICCWKISMLGASTSWISVLTKCCAS